MVNFEVIIESKVLNYVLSLSSAVIERRNVIPILANVKMEAIPGGLVITASSGDVSFRQRVPAKVKGVGSITVEAQVFVNVVRKIDDSEIEIVYLQEKQCISVRGACCDFNLGVLPASEYPEMPEVGDSGIMFYVSSMDIVKLIKYTEFAVSLETTRYNLSGIFLHTIDETLNIAAAATDGHRLSALSIEKTASGSFGIILPRKVAQEVIKVFQDGRFVGQEISVKVENNRVQFSNEEVVIISKVIDGVFPDYQKLIPARDDWNILQINAHLLYNVIDRVSTIAMDRLRTIKFVLTKEQCELSAYSDNIGNAREWIIFDDHTTYNGENLIIGFNAKYLMDVLTALEDKTVCLYFCNATSATLITVMNDTSAKFVIMPVRV